MNKELRAKTNEELVDLVVKLKGQLLQYRFKKAHGELEKHHLIKETKRLLARIYTILTERQVNVNITGKLNAVMAQNAEVSAKANQVREQLKAQRAEKKAKSKQRRQENQAKVASQPKQALKREKRFKKAAPVKTAAKTVKGKNAKTAKTTKRRGSSRKGA